MTGQSAMLAGGGRLLSSCKAFLSGCKKKKICYNSDILHHNYNGVCMKKNKMLSIKESGLSNQTKSWITSLELAMTEKSTQIYKNNTGLFSRVNRLCRAFTLAEVLITLGIIGVVAAMTMPSLIANHKEKETIAKLKKFYSVMSQAYLSVINENGTADSWEKSTNNTADASKDLYMKFKPYISVIKECGKDKGCFPDVYYKKLNGANSLNFENDGRYKIKLADGSTLAFYGFSALGGSDDVLSSYGAIYYDINGVKSPNQFGKDLFQITLLKDRIIPTSSNNPDTSAILNECITDGFSCMAWIIANDNMDYLHCPDDLNWDSKTTCK